VQFVRRASDFRVGAQALFVQRHRRMEGGAMHREATSTPWEDGTAPRLPVLDADVAADVLVVGAGIAGLSTAAHLAESGMRVAVLDRVGIGAGETGRTTAHLTAVLDARFARLEQLHGVEGARLVAASHGAAIADIERRASTSALDCAFRRVDAFLFEEAQDGRDGLLAEADAARRAGVLVEEMARAPLPFDTAACLRFANQAQVHPLLYLQALARTVESLGGRLYRGEATRFEDGEPVRVETSDGRVLTGRALVIATDSPVNDRVVIHTKQPSYRTYAIAFEGVGDLPAGLFWDTADPYHYVRRAGTGPGDRLIVGGEDHRTGQVDDADLRYTRLEEWARERFGSLGPVGNRWSGQVQEPVDGLGYIGRNPGDRHVYVATGFSGNGMTHGALAGRIISDLVLDRESPWAKLYDPGRIRWRAVPTFVRENANTAAQYADLVTPGEVADVDDIAPGEGAVLREGLKKTAVYRDEAGVVHACSAICPHLGCVVAWNGGEKTWDCPCHGSRFDVDGAVLHGPALSPLGEVSSDAPLVRPATVE
jgi:glycine/D-amino acid oxidase-like deaminating enzyme/nitrite reductase/ring-hydroxylating ferredoxin subunit